jgi:hypothetical protein
LDTFLWLKNAPAFSAFTTSAWFSEQRKVSRPWVREPTLNNRPLATLSFSHPCVLDSGNLCRNDGLHYLKSTALVPSPLRDDRQGWWKCGSRYGNWAVKVRMRGTHSQFNRIGTSLLFFKQQTSPKPYPKNPNPYPYRHNNRFPTKSSLAAGTRTMLVAR